MKSIANLGHNKHILNRQHLDFVLQILAPTRKEGKYNLKENHPEGNTLLTQKFCLPCLTVLRRMLLNMFSNLILESNLIPVEVEGHYRIAL